VDGGGGGARGRAALPAMGGPAAPRRAGGPVSFCLVTDLLLRSYQTRANDTSTTRRGTHTYIKHSPAVLESGALQVDAPRIRSHACLHALVARLAPAAQEAAARHLEAVRSRGVWFGMFFFVWQVEWAWACWHSPASKSHN
jgi:hypothetical protein